MRHDPAVNRPWVQVVRGAILCTFLVTSACGTRSGETRNDAAQGLAVTRPGGAEVSSAPAATEAAAPTVPHAPAVNQKAVPTPGAAGGSTRVSGSSGTTPMTGGPVPKAAPSSASATPAAAKPASGTAPAPPPAAPDPSGPVPSVGNRPAIAIGSVGSYSGPPASSTLPSVEGLQFWVRSVNVLGGLKGHQVKLFVADDGADPARHRQLVQELVERRGVSAFVQMNGAITGQGSVGYLTEKRVPVINSDGAGDWYYKSPVFFPIAPHGEQAIKSSLYQAGEYARKKGVKKYGVLACTEAQMCTDMVRLHDADHVRTVGLELVYTGRTSLAQPDFTAECISARNAGVQILQVLLDSNSVSRLAASCARQGYRPLYTVIGGIAVDTMKKDPNLEGLSVTSYAFPYFLCEVGGRQFCDAVRRFGPAHGLGVATSNGWTAGKAFERAAQNIGDGDVTAQQILDGLWSFKDETLDGITLPLTFTKDQTAPRRTCWWPLVVVNQQFTAPDGVNVRCVT